MIVDRPKTSQITEETGLWGVSGSMSATFGDGEAWPLAPVSQEVVQIQQMLLELRTLLSSLTHTAELPEIFDLPAVTSERVKICIRDRGYIPFQLVTEESDLD